ncbi:hypothetical protein L6452_23360 [Arctium lappa]|uniref:Uncharacterized protein n=1 Tax=Arctium lappa TaxID=4217 RepID=A0ACB9B202_ARCLA|nr:hypothetical protein L6452_23360 [Arctium lappa]
MSSSSHLRWNFMLFFLLFSIQSGLYGLFYSEAFDFVLSFSMDIECEDAGDFIGGDFLEQVDGGRSNVIVSSEDYSGGVEDELVASSSGFDDIGDGFDEVEDGFDDVEDGFDDVENDSFHKCFNEHSDWRNPNRLTKSCCY